MFLTMHLSFFFTLYPVSFHIHPSLLIFAFISILKNIYWFIFIHPSLLSILCIHIHFCIHIFQWINPSFSFSIIVTSAVYVRLVLNYDLNYWIRPTQLFEWINLNLKQISPGVSELWSDIQTNKQRLQLKKYRNPYIYYFFLKIFIILMFPFFRQ